MEGGISHPNQAIDIGAHQRVRCPHDRCPRQPSARPAAAGVVVALQKISWICSCNVPRPLQLECKTTSTAAREGNPINRGPGSRQKAPVRERCDSPAPTVEGPLWQPGPSTVAADPDTTPSRERRRVLYIPPMEGNIMHLRTRPSTSARASVFAARTSGVPGNPRLALRQRGLLLPCTKFLGFVAATCHGRYKSNAKQPPSQLWRETQSTGARHLAKRRLTAIGAIAPPQLRRARSPPAAGRRPHGRQHLCGTP